MGRLRLPSSRRAASLAALLLLLSLAALTQQATGQELTEPESTQDSCLAPAIYVAGNDDPSICGPNAVYCKHDVDTQERVRCTINNITYTLNYREPPTPSNITYFFTDNGNEVTLPDPNWVQIVIIKAGSNYCLYNTSTGALPLNTPLYPSPPAYFVTPIAGNNNQPRGLSHISVCLSNISGPEPDYAVNISGQGSYNTGYVW